MFGQFADAFSPLAGYHMENNATAASSQNRLDKFWAYVTVFGTLWGGLELTLGTFLHVLRVPKTGLIMVTLSVILLIAQRRIFPARGSTLCAGIVAACIKSLSPGGIIAGPIFGIMSEAIVVELCLLMSSRSAILNIWAGMCAVAWSQVQSLFKMWIYYGQDFIAALARVVEKFLRVEWSAALGWTLLTAFFGIVAAIGAAAGLIGAHIGRRVRKEIEQKYREETEFGHQSGLQNNILQPNHNTELIAVSASLQSDAGAPAVSPQAAENRDQTANPALRTDRLADAPQKRKRPVIDNAQVIKNRRFVLPVALITLAAQFSGQLAASSAALAVWIIALAIASRPVLRAIWWPKFWAVTAAVSVASGVLIAWKLDGAWQWSLGLQASARMMIRGIYVFSLIGWMTRALRPQECLSVWKRLNLPQLGLAVTRAYALLPAWNEKLREIVRNRPAGRRRIFAYARENIIACLVEASMQTELISLDEDKAGRQEE